MAARGAAGAAAAGDDFGRALTALALVVAVFLGLVVVPGDDGLRHVGLAFGDPRSWGAVYPHSVFARHPGYDPWWGYDLALRGAAALAGLLPLPRLAAQLLVVKALTCAFAAAFLLLAVRRAGLRSAVRSPAGLVAAAALVVVFLSLPLSRVLTVRPFVLGSLYLLVALPGGGVARGAAGALALAFFYPYLFFVYTLPVAAAHLVRGDRRYGAAAAAATAAAIAVQPRAFWGLLADLARSDATRGALDTKIMELSPGSSQPLVVALVALALVCLPAFLPARARRVGVPHLVLLFYLPAAAKYLRYLIDVPPLLLFVIGAEALVGLWTPPVERVGRFWRERASAALARLAGDDEAPAARADAPAPGRSSLRPWIALAAVALAVVVAVAEMQRQRDFASLERALSGIAPGSLVLAEFNAQYPLLYVRPDLRLVPSCEIGFPDDAIRDPYLRFFNDGDPCSLAAAVGAAHFVGLGTMGLAPDRSACLERTAAAATGAYRTLVVWKTGVPGR